MSHRLEQKVSEPDFNVRFNELLKGVTGQNSFDALTQAMHQFNDLLDCKGSIITLCSGTPQDIEDYRFVLACDINFKEQYRDKKWFQIDPYILYAQTNTAPVLLDSVIARSPGQKRLLAASRESGYRSGAVIAAHSPVKTACMSVLYIGSDEPEYFNEQSLEASKMYLRAIAAEVLEWRLKFKRLQILGELQLTEDERELLMLCRQGYSSREIASLTSRSKASIDQKFSRTARRLGVKSRQQAGTLAWELGLLS